MYETYREGYFHVVSLKITRIANKVPTGGFPSCPVLINVYRMTSNTNKERSPTTPREWVTSRIGTSMNRPHRHSPSSTHVFYMSCSRFSVATTRARACRRVVRRWCSLSHLSVRRYGCTRRLEFFKDATSLLSLHLHLLL